MKRGKGAGQRPADPAESGPRPVVRNVVLTRLAAQAMRDRFVGWQCRVRQFAVRQDAGRPSTGMRPRLLTISGDVLAEGVTVLISESEPEQSITQFRYQFLKTQDPNERYEKILEFLQERYFQEPARFSDELTALFDPSSLLCAKLAELGRCVLQFEQSSQLYRLVCTVKRLASSHPRYQATFWHNRLFNPSLPPEPEVLMFTPDWPHSEESRETDA
jgi:hypothetical protein